MNGRQRKLIKLMLRVQALKRNGCPLKVNVRCNGNQLHQIGISPRGRLYLVQHPRKQWQYDKAMSALAGGKQLRCHRALAAWKELHTKYHYPTASVKYVKEFPGGLSRTFMQLCDRTSLGRGHKATKPEPGDYPAYRSFWDMYEKAIAEASNKAYKTFHGFTYAEQRYSLNNFNASWTVRAESRDWLLNIHRAGLSVVDGYLVMHIESQSNVRLKAEVVVSSGVVRWLHWVFFNTLAIPLKTRSVLLCKGTKHLPWWKRWWNKPDDNWHICRWL